MNVVLDTNIFVAAGFNPRSNSAKIISQLEQGSLNLVWDQATLKETKFIIDKISPLNWDKFANLFKIEHEFKDQTHPDQFNQVQDPDDRKFAALAAASKAALITNDDHLLTHKKRLPITIQTPSEFLEQNTV